MNETLRSPGKNSNQRKSRKQTFDGVDKIEVNGQPKETLQLLEPLKLSEKILSDELSREGEEKCIVAYVENMNEDMLKQNEQNLATTKGPSEEGHLNSANGIEKTEKYEEMDVSIIKNEVMKMKEKTPSFQDQIFIAASNRLKKHVSIENILPLDNNYITVNESNEIQDISNNVETNSDDHRYSTAKTLRMGTLKQEEKYEFSQVERINALNNQNADIFLKNYSSSENEQDSDDFITDTAIETILDDLKSLNKEMPMKPDESKRVVIHESKYESKFKYKEKHFVSKFGKQFMDNLAIKPLSLQLSRPEQALPVITTQPPLQSMQDAMLIKSLPTTDFEIIDDVDTQICCNNQIKTEIEDNYSALITAQYKSSCALDCLCCIVQSFI